MKDANKTNPKLVALVLSLVFGLPVLLTAISFLANSMVDKTDTQISQVATVTETEVVKTTEVATTTSIIKTTNSCIVEDQTISEMEDSPIRIHYNYYDKDYANGSKLNITIENNSNKVVKYVYYQIYYYNRVGDLCYDEIARRNNITWKFVGPLNPGETANSDTQEFYSVEFAGKIAWGDIRVEYMDGSALIIPSSEHKYYYNLH